MKLFLFGGAEIPLNQVEPLKVLIKKVIVDLHPDSILHIPHARLHPTEEEWKEGWFKEMMKDTGIKILDARNESEIDQAVNPLIFINGGTGRRTLANELNTNKKLFSLVQNAQYIVAESAGSMVMGEFLRADRDGDEITKGFGILKNTIIEVHYTERSRQQLLIDDMEKSGMKYGLGIDCTTAIVVDPKEFPEKWEKIGNGSVDVKIT